MAQQDEKDKNYTYDEAVDEIAKKYGVPKAVYSRMVGQESGGNDNAVSPKGASSRWQIMPATAKGLGIDASDPLQAAEGGLRLLRDNYKRFRGKAENEKHAWMMAVAGYHGNPNNVEKDLKKGGYGLPEISDGSITTRDHVLKIFDGLKGDELDRSPNGPINKAPAQKAPPALAPTPQTPQEPQNGTPPVPYDPAKLWPTETQRQGGPMDNGDQAQQDGQTQTQTPTQGPRPGQYGYGSQVPPGELPPVAYPVARPDMTKPAPEFEQAQTQPVQQQRTTTVKMGTGGSGPTPGQQKGAVPYNPDQDTEVPDQDNNPAWMKGAPKEIKRSVDLSRVPWGKKRETLIQQLIPEIAASSKLDAIDVEKELREGGIKVDPDSRGITHDLEDMDSFTFRVTQDFLDRVDARKVRKQNILRSNIASGDDVNPELLSEKYGLDPAEVEKALTGKDPKYVDAVNDRNINRARFENIRDTYAASPLTDESPFAATIRAKRDMGWLTDKGAQTQLAKVDELYKSLLGEFTTGAPLDLRGIGQAKLGEEGQVGKEFNVNQAKDAVDQLLKPYGGDPEIYYKYQEELRNQGNVGLIDDNVKAFGKYVAKLPAAALELGAMGLQALAKLDPNAATSQAIFGKINTSPLVDAAADAAENWRKMIDEHVPFKQNEAYKHNWLTKELNAISEGVAQFAVQSILATPTAGMSILLPMAEAGGEQWRKARAAGATENQQIVSGVIGMLAGAPEVVMHAGMLKELLPEKSFMRMLGEKFHAKFLAFMPEEEAAVMTSSFMHNFESAIKMSAIRVGEGYVMESGQEYTEDVTNKIAARNTYEAGTRDKQGWIDTLKEVFVPTEDEMRGYRAAGFVGALGGAISAIAELSDLELVQAKKTLPEMMAQSRYEKADQEKYVAAIMPHIMAELKKRDIKTSSPAKTEEEVKTSIKGQVEKIFKKEDPGPLQPHETSDRPVEPKTGVEGEEANKAIIASSKEVERQEKKEAKETAGMSQQEIDQREFDRKANETFQSKVAPKSEVMTDQGKGTVLREKGNSWAIKLDSGKTIQRGKDKVTKPPVVPIPRVEPLSTTEDPKEILRQKIEQAQRPTTPTGERPQPPATYTPPFVQPKGKKPLTAPTPADAPQGQVKSQTEWKPQVSEKDGITTTRYIGTRPDGKTVRYGGPQMSPQAFIQEFGVAEASDLEQLNDPDVGIAKVTILETRETPDGKGAATVRVQDAQNHGVEMEIRFQRPEKPNETGDTPVTPATPVKPSAPVKTAPVKTAPAPAKPATPAKPAKAPEKPATVADIHALAKSKGLDVDSQAFKTLSKQHAGVAHLDSMNPKQLAAVAKAINNGKFSSAKAQEKKAARVFKENDHAYVMGPNGQHQLIRIEEVDPDGKHLKVTNFDADKTQRILAVNVLPDESTLAANAMELPGDFIKRVKKDPNFNKWAGGKVAKNYSGDPLLLFHGSINWEGDELDPTKTHDFGFHFGNYTQASRRISYQTADGTWKNKPNSSMLAGAIRIGKSLRMEDRSYWSPSNMVPDLIADKVITKEEGAQVLNETTPKEQEQALKDLLKLHGYGSIIYKNKFEDEDHPENYSDSYIIFDYTEFKNYYNSGAFEEDGGMLAAIAAGHGTPFHFDRFSNEKINTGEGFQAFGWGLYFASSHNIQQDYRNNVTKKRNYPDPQYSHGTIYKVELAPEEYELMRWDKKLEGQSEYIQNLVKEHDLPFEKHMTGEKFYKSLAATYIDKVGSKLSYKETSQFLYSKGIKGNKYLQGTHRRKGEGDYNYVIFNDEDVSIKVKIKYFGKNSYEVENLETGEKKIFEDPDEKAIMAWISQDDTLSNVEKLIAKNSKTLEEGKKTVEIFRNLSKDLEVPPSATPADKAALKKVKLSAMERMKHGDNVQWSMQQLVKDIEKIYERVKTRVGQLREAEELKTKPIEEQAKKLGLEKLPDGTYNFTLSNLTISKNGVISRASRQSKEVLKYSLEPFLDKISTISGKNVTLINVKIPHLKTASNHLTLDGAVALPSLTRAVGLGLGGTKHSLPKLERVDSWLSIVSKPTDPVMRFDSLKSVGGLSASPRNRTGTNRAVAPAEFPKLTHIGEVSIELTWHAYQILPMSRIPGYDGGYTSHLDKDPAGSHADRITKAGPEALLKELKAELKAPNLKTVHSLGIVNGKNTALSNEEYGDQAKRFLKLELSSLINDEYKTLVSEMKRGIGRSVNALDNLINPWINSYADAKEQKLTADRKAEALKYDAIISALPISKDGKEAFRQAAGSVIAAEYGYYFRSFATRVQKAFEDSLPKGSLFLDVGDHENYSGIRTGRAEKLLLPPLKAALDELIKSAGDTETLAAAAQNPSPGFKDQKARDARKKGRDLRKPSEIYSEKQLEHMVSKLPEKERNQINFQGMYKGYSSNDINNDVDRKLKHGATDFNYALERILFGLEFEGKADETTIRKIIERVLVDQKKGPINRSSDKLIEKWKKGETFLEDLLDEDNLTEIFSVRPRPKISRDAYIEHKFQSKDVSDQWFDDNVGELTEEAGTALIDNFKTAQEDKLLAETEILGGDEKQAGDDYWPSTLKSARDTETLTAPANIIKAVEAKGTAAQWINKNEKTGVNWTPIVRAKTPEEGMKLLKAEVQKRYEEKVKKTFEELENLDLSEYLAFQMENPHDIENPQVQQAVYQYRNDPQGAADYINKIFYDNRKEIFTEWKRYLERDNPTFAKDPFYREFIWNDLMNIRNNRPDLPSGLDRAALSAVHRDIEATPNQSTFQALYDKKVIDLMYEDATDGEQVGVKDGTWIKIPQTDKPEKKANTASYEGVLFHGEVVPLENAQDPKKATALEYFSYIFSGQERAKDPKILAKVVAGYPIIEFEEAQTIAAGAFEAIGEKKKAKEIRGYDEEEFERVRSGEDEELLKQWETFNKAVNKVKAVSRKTWCTSQGMADSYIQLGDFWVLIKKDKTKLGVRFQNGAVAEIQGKANDGTIPEEHLPEMKDLIRSGKIEMTISSMDQMLRAIKESKFTNKKREFLAEAEKVDKEAEEKFGVKETAFAKEVLAHGPTTYLREMTYRDSVSFLKQKIEDARTDLANKKLTPESYRSLILEDLYHGLEVESYFKNNKNIPTGLRMSQMVEGGKEMMESLLDAKKEWTPETTKLLSRREKEFIQNTAKAADFLTRGITTKFLDAFDPGYVEEKKKPDTNTLDKYTKEEKDLANSLFEVIAASDEWSKLNANNFDVEAEGVIRKAVDTMSKNNWAKGDLPLSKALRDDPKGLAKLATEIFFADPNMSGHFNGKIDDFNKELKSPVDNAVDYVEGHLRDLAGGFFELDHWNLKDSNADKKEAIERMMENLYRYDDAFPPLVDAFTSPDQLDEFENRITPEFVDNLAKEYLDKKKTELNKELEGPKPDIRKFNDSIYTEEYHTKNIEKYGARNWGIALSTYQWVIGTHELESFFNKYDSKGEINQAIKDEINHQSRPMPLDSTAEDKKLVNEATEQLIKDGTAHYAEALKNKKEELNKELGEGVDKKFAGTTVEPFAKFVYDFDLEKGVKKDPDTTLAINALKENLLHSLNNSVRVGHSPASAIQQSAENGTILGSLLTYSGDVRVEADPKNRTLNELWNQIPKADKDKIRDHFIDLGKELSDLAVSETKAELDKELESEVAPEETKAIVAEVEREYNFWQDLSDKGYSQTEVSIASLVLDQAVALPDNPYSQQYEDISHSSLDAITLPDIEKYIAGSPLQNHVAQWFIDEPGARNRVREKMRTEAPRLTELVKEIFEFRISELKKKIDQKKSDLEAELGPEPEKQEEPHLTETQFRDKYKKEFEKLYDKFGKAQLRLATEVWQHSFMARMDLKLILDENNRLTKYAKDLVPEKIAEQRKFGANSEADPTKVSETIDAIHALIDLGNLPFVTAYEAREKEREKKEKEEVENRRKDAKSGLSKKGREVYDTILDSIEYEGIEPNEYGDEGPMNIGAIDQAFETLLDDIWTYNDPNILENYESLPEKEKEKVQELVKKALEELYAKKKAELDSELEGDETLGANIDREVLSLQGAKINKKFFQSDFNFVRDEDGNLHVSPKVTEFLRETESERLGREKAPMTAGMMRTATISGAISSIQDRLDGKYKRWTDAEKKPIRDLLTALRKAEKARSLVIYADPKRVPHEMGHLARYVNSQFSDSIAGYYKDFQKTFAVTADIAKKAFENFFSRIYFGDRDFAKLTVMEKSILQEEMVAHILEGGWEEMGLTDLEAAKFMHNDLEGYVEKNGENVFKDLEKWINEKYRQRILAGKNLQEKFRETVKSIQAKTAGVAPRSAETDKKRSGSTENGERKKPPFLSGLGLGEGLKERATPITVSEHTQTDLDDIEHNARYYEPGSMQAADRLATEWLDDRGISNAINELYDLPVNALTTAKRMAVLKYLDRQIDEYMAQGNEGRAREVYDRMVGVTNAIAPEYTEWGQAIAQLAYWSHLDPNAVVNIVENRREKRGKQRGSLSLSEQQRLRDEAKAIQELDKEIDELNSKIKGNSRHIWQGLLEDTAKLKEAGYNILKKAFGASKDSTTLKAAAQDPKKKISKAETLKATAQDRRSISELDKLTREAALKVGMEKYYAGKAAGGQTLAEWKSSVINALEENRVDPAGAEPFMDSLYLNVRYRARQEYERKEIDRVKKAYGIADEGAARLKLIEIKAQQAARAKQEAQNLRDAKTPKDTRTAFEIGLDQNVEGMPNKESLKEDIKLAPDKNAFYKKYAEQGMKPDEITRKYLDSVQRYIEINEDLKEARTHARVTRAISEPGITKLASKEEIAGYEKKLKDARAAKALKLKDFKETVKHLTERPETGKAKAADWYLRLNRAGETNLTAQVKTLTHNLGAQRMTKMFNALETGIELAIAKLELATGRDIFAEDKLGIESGVKFSDILLEEMKSSTFPGVRAAISEFKNGQADLFEALSTTANYKQRVVQGVLAHNPDLYDAMIGKFTYGDGGMAKFPIEENYGKVGRKIEMGVRGVEAFTHFATTLNRVQEKHFRFATFMGTLAADLKSQGFDVEQVFNGKIDALTRKTLERAVNRALQDTFGEDIPKTDPVNRFIAQTSNLMKWIPFPVNPMLFRRFLWNSSKFMLEHSPIMLLKAAGPGLTKRDLAKVVSGMGLYVLALAILAAAGSDDDDPTTITIMGYTFRVSAYNPISSYLILANVVNRARKGKTPLKNIDELWKIFGVDTRYPNLALDWFGSLAGVVSTEEESKYTKLDEKTRQIAGKGVSAYLKAFTTLKDIQSAFDPEEGTVRDYADEPLLGELKKTLPLSEMFARTVQGKNTPAREDAMTGEDIKKEHPLLDQLGITIVPDAQVGPKFTGAEEYLDEGIRRERQSRPKYYKTPDERRSSAILAQLYTNIDKGMDVSKRVPVYVKEGKISKDQGDAVMRAAQIPSNIERKAKEATIPSIVKSLDLATPQERQKALKILAMKARNQGKNNTLTPDEKAALKRVPELSIP